MTSRVVSRRASLAVALLLSVDLSLGSAQSLGEVARREAERRTQVADGRLYTNADLSGSDASTPSPSSSPAGAAAGATTAAADASAPTKETQATDGDVADPILKARDKHDESYWRALNKELRGRLANANAAVARWDARLKDIEAGPQTPTLVREREVVTASVTRLKRDARSHFDGLTRFLTRAHVANVPEEWIR